MTTDERLEKLEQELCRGKRRNKLLVVGLGLAFGLCGLIWAITGTPGTAKAQEGAAAPTKIHANEFVMDDETGKARAALVMADGEPRLVMFDENGKNRFSLAVKKNGGAMLNLKGDNERSGITLAIVPDQTIGVDLFDNDGNPRAVLNLDKDGSPFMQILNADGTAKWKTP